LRTSAVTNIPTEAAIRPAKAQRPKARTNRDCSGMSVAPIVCDAMIAAQACAPMRPPSCLLTLLIPSATAVSPRATDSSVMCALALVTIGSPNPIRTSAATTSAGVEFQRATRARPAAIDAHPATSGHFAPALLRRIPPTAGAPRPGIAQASI
jgi:hypothetical protein